MEYILFDMPATTLENAYIAGFVDGEGSIGFSKTNVHKLGNGFHYVPRIIIGNTDKSILEWIKSLYGGSVVARKIHNPNWKQGYVLDLCSRKALRLAEAVKPYIKIKAEQINLLVEIYEKDVLATGFRFNKRRRNLESGQFESREPTQEQFEHYAVLEEYYQRFKKLNHRGIQA